MGTLRGFPAKTLRWLEPVLFGAAFVLYAAVVPLGLGRVDGAPLVADAFALQSGTSGHFLALFAMRLGQYLPLGDTALRATCVSALFSALAVALVGRLALGACTLLRPPANARQLPRHFAHEPIAAVGAAVASALTLSTFELGLTATTAAATLALLVGALLAAFALLRDCRRAGVAYVLSALAGLSAGVDAVAGPLLWPLLLALAIWSLRRGARWPLVAPLCFVAAWSAAALASVAVSPAALTLHDVLAGLSSVGVARRAALWPSLVELADQVGVIGSLLAIIGAVALAVRATVVAIWLFLTFAITLLIVAAAFAGLADAPTRAAFPVAAAIVCTFAAAGLVHVAARLGRARAAGAFALAAILVLSPALDGGARRWARRTTAAMHLLDRALERTPIRHLVCPGTREMEGLFRLAKAQGLRPDVDLGRCRDR